MFISKFITINHVYISRTFYRQGLLVGHISIVPRNNGLGYIYIYI